MAKKKLIAIVVVGLMVVAGGFYPMYADLARGGDGGNFKVNLPIYASPAGNASFELATEFPEVGDRAMVYRVKAPDVTVDKVLEMGRRLGFAVDAALEQRAEEIVMLYETS